MAWEARGSGRYFYRKRRVGGRVVSEYVGAGEVAELVALAGQAQQESRRAESALWLSWRSEREADGRAADGALAGLERLAHAALEAAGYHRHQGQWRKRRMAGRTMARRGQTAPRRGAGRGTGERATWADLMERANTGDGPALAAFRDELEKNPDLLEVVGNPVWLTTYNVLDRLWGRRQGYRAAAECKLKALRDELAGPDPSPAERLLADRAALCWLRVHQLECQYDRSKDLSIRQADFLQRQIDRAHRRFLSALKTLETIRRPAAPAPAPAVQINLARQQVNVAGPPETPRAKGRLGLKAAQADDPTR